MNKKVRLLVSVALLGWFAWCTNWTQVGQAFSHLRVELWVAAVLLYVVTQLVSAVRWRLLAEPLGFQRPLPQLAAFYFIGMYFNLFLPTSVGGDVVRAWYLDGGSGRKLAAFLSVFVDRFSGLLILLLLACVAAAVCPVTLKPWITGSVWVTAGCAAAALLSLPWLGRLTARFDSLRRLVGNLRIYLDLPGLLLTTSALSLLVQVANVVIVWLVGQAIDAPIPASYYWILVPMVTLLTLLPSLNGIGIREGGMILFLGPLGVEESTALTLSFLWFSVFTAVSLGGAAIYLFGNFARPVEQANDRSFGSDSDQGRTRQSKAA